MRLLHLVFIFIFSTSLVYAGEPAKKEYKTSKAADILIEFDEAQVNRSTKTDSSWNFMDINLSLTGEGLKETKWYYDPVYTRVDTESGSLLKSDDNWNSRRVWRLKEITEKQNKFRLWQRVNAPARQDQTLFIEGYVEVYEQDGDHNIVVISDHLSQSKKIIDAPLFKKHKIEFLFLTKDDIADLRKNEEQAKGDQSVKDAEALGKAFAESFAKVFSDMFGMSDNDLTFVIKNGNDPVLNIVLINEKGEIIEVNSRSISKDEKDGSIRYGVKYKKMLPHKGKIRVYIDDGKSLRKVPFKFQVKLP